MIRKRTFSLICLPPFCQNGLLRLILSMQEIFHVTKFSARIRTRDGKVKSLLELLGSAYTSKITLYLNKGGSRPLFGFFSLFLGSLFEIAIDKFDNDDDDRKLERSKKSLRSSSDLSVEKARRPVRIDSQQF